MRAEVRKHQTELTQSGPIGQRKTLVLPRVEYVSPQKHPRKMIMEFRRTFLKVIPVLGLLLISPLTFAAALAPLPDAASRGDLGEVRRLLDSGVDVNSRNKGGQTALHWAALRGHAAAAELLVSRSAEIDANDRHGTTPLHLAARTGRSTVLEMLVSHGADVRARDEHDGTALHLAALGGHASVAGILLNAGAEIDSKNQEGFSPLMVSVSKKHLKDVKGSDPFNPL
jgi:ankyrin repeat protein